MTSNQTIWSRWIAQGLRSGRTAFASFVRQRLEARKRRIERDKEFYVKLAAYCRSNNLPAVCGEDWKTAAYSKDR
jgi:hypothetical protein